MTIETTTVLPDGSLWIERADGTARIEAEGRGVVASFPAEDRDEEERP
jgi:hypothetical protein